MKLLCLLLVLSFATPALAAGALEKAHLKKKVTCVACHQTAKPTKAATSATCITCHGDARKVAEKTNDIHPNPHVPHDGPMDCLVCHHVHRASEIKCNECHVYDFERRKRKGEG